MTATAIDLEGKLTIRRSLYIRATPARVWREFETFDRFAAWFGVLVDEFDRNGVRRLMGHRVITYEPHAGGHVELEVEVDGAMRRFGGRIEVFDTERELTFEDEWIPAVRDTTLLLTLRLTAHDGGTIVELISHGFERLGEAGAEEHRGHESNGWTTRQLEALRRIVESE
jgi:uncharacterized protein YndB with AHSA1/START domain